ncbi:MAG: phosphoserine phosphatase [Halieaceae bacterium]|jgi:phosphoserine phosphatase
MLVGFKLSRDIPIALLPALLGGLKEAESVVFETQPPGLACTCEPGWGAVLEQALGARLSALGEPWEARVSAGVMPDVEAFYELADAVLTVIVPSGLELPPELGTMLTEWDVQLVAMRRLTPAGGRQPLALEFYFDGWSRYQGRRPQLHALSLRWGIDICLTRSDSKRPRRRLIAFDMDSTLIQCEVIDELAVRAGVGAEVAEVTARAMRGELDFCGSFRERMARLRGLAESELTAVADTLPLMPGAASLMRILQAQGHYTVILSGGFDLYARQLQSLLGFTEVHANTLQIEAGVLTGHVQGEIVDGDRKVALLREIAAAQGFPMADTVAVGDGANDLPMLDAAGLGVAFHAKPLVRERAACAVNHAPLDALLHLLGVAQSRG